MAPKRKAPISGTTPAPRPAAAAGKPTSVKPSAGGKQQQQQNKKRGGGQPAAGPSKPKKARVEVEFEGGEQPAAAVKGKGRGEGSATALAAAPVRAVVPSEAGDAPSSTANSKGKKLAFAESEEPSSSAAVAAGTSTPKRAVPTGPKTFQVVAGSYEKLLYGLQGVLPSASTPVAERDYSMKPIFIFPAHQACVKTVAASEGGKWLATGSSDEVVKIWDLRRRKEVGGLQQHTGSITSLHFPSRTHLITASEDSTVTLFRTRDWNVLRSFKGHVGRVNSVNVHPTGKLALSLGKDRTMKMWDLMKGKAGGSVKLGKEGEIVRFSPSGALFAILSTTTLDLYNMDMSPLTTLTNPKRFHDFHFVSVPAGEGEGAEASRELLVAAVEEGFTRVYECVQEVREGDDGKEGWGKMQQGEWKEVGRLVGHTHRVKALSPLYPLLASVSSDGFVNLYDLSQLPARVTGVDAALPELAPVSQYDTKKTRLTCVTMAEGGALAVGEDGEEAEESSSEEELDENEDDEDGTFESDEELSGEDGMVEQEDEDEDEAEYE